MKRLAMLLLVLSACLSPRPRGQPDPYVITLLIENQSTYLIAAGGAGRVFGSLNPGEDKCVTLPNNDVQQQLWFRVQATETQQYTLPFYPRESSGWKWTITGIGPPEHPVGRADAANIVHWRQCR
ncbi:MAG: hypothetical protein JSW71_04115 [Gemmatimonadota bacterium]|nr:MAG: hypothetical protein JSW71_04115 [Gemmatimonadota bacterium]